MITSFHEEMRGTVQHDGSSLDPFPIKSWVKEGCVLALTLSRILFSLLLRYAFSESEEGIYLHTRRDGSLFNLARLRGKTKERKVFVREMLFADDAAITAHIQTALEELIRDLQIQLRLRARVRLLSARGLGLNCRRHCCCRRQLATKIFQ